MEILTRKRRRPLIENMKIVLVIRKEDRIFLLCVLFLLVVKTSKASVSFAFFFESFRMTRTKEASRHGAGTRRIYRTKRIYENTTRIGKITVNVCLSLSLCLRLSVRLSLSILIPIVITLGLPSRVSILAADVFGRRANAYKYSRHPELVRPRFHRLRPASRLPKLS